jgi:hypothetical protein
VPESVFRPCAVSRSAADRQPGDPQLERHGHWPGTGSPGPRSPRPRAGSWRRGVRRGACSGSSA